MEKSTFGTFDAFKTETERETHLQGKIAAALIQNTNNLLSLTPNIEFVSLLAVKQ
jgi:hypothetical protein